MLASISKNIECATHFQPLSLSSGVQKTCSQGSQREVRPPLSLSRISSSAAAAIEVVSKGREEEGRTDTDHKFDPSSSSIHGEEGGGGGREEEGIFPRVCRRRFILLFFFFFSPSTEFLSYFSTSQR